MTKIFLPWLKKLLRASYQYKGRNILDQARDAATERYNKQVGTNEDGTPKWEAIPQYYNNYGISFFYEITPKALKSLVQHHTKSDNVGVHAAVLDKLHEVINGSIEYEEDPDVPKINGVRDISKGVNDKALMHRFYGAVIIDGKPYRVMTLMREEKNPVVGNGIHAYEVQKIEVLDEETPNTPNGVGSHPQPKVGSSYPLAKLLQNVGKSYEKEKKLLDESKIADESTDLYRDPDETEDIWNDQSMGLDETLYSRGKKTTPSERDGAVSGNPSAEGLPQGGSAHQSRNPHAQPLDAAKVRQNTEVTMRSIKKILNKGEILDGKRAIKTESQAIRALGNALHLDRADTSQSYYGDFYEGDLIAGDQTVRVRISTHPANGARIGNAPTDDKLSIVIRKNGEHFSSGEHGGYTEYIYEPGEISPADAANAIVKGIEQLIVTGEFVDDTAIFLYFDRRFSQTFRLEKGSITRKNSKFVRFLIPQSKLNLLTQITLKKQHYADFTHRTCRNRRHQSGRGHSFLRELTGFQVLRH
ncbi:MAG: hypothetical protein J6N71_03305 [Muribaculaceae bacterium]|nr:hypothetical protein [Muribaculaceae bacterium]